MQPARAPVLSSLIERAGGGMAVAVAPLVLGYLLLAPPASGDMLLVPMSATARDELGAKLGDRAISFIGRGPLDGSLVVRAELPLVRNLLHDEAVLVLAVPDGGCGGVIA